MITPTNPEKQKSRRDGITVTPAVSKILSPIGAKLYPHTQPPENTKAPESISFQGL